MKTKRAWMSWAGLAFPLVLWFVATFFLMGDIGRWLDDWFYVQRVPESGEIRSLVLDRQVHFWRPLYKVVVPALATVLDDHTRLHHLLCALAHGLNAALLWKLLLQLGSRRLAASIGALFFLVFPAAYEVVFWLCNLPTALSTSACLGALLVVAGVARRGGGVGVPSVLLAAMTFVAACLNEQPPAMLGAAALVWCMATGRRLVSMAMLRCWPLAASVLVAVVLYAICHHRYAPVKPSVDGSSFFVSLDRVPLVVMSVARWTWEWTLSIGTMRRMLWHAGEVATEHPVRSVVVLLSLLVAGGCWVRVQMDRGHEVPNGTPMGAARPAATIVLGGVIGVATFAPIVVTNYWLNPRVLYAPSVGLAVILAGVCMVPGSRASDRLELRRRERLCAAVLAALVLAVMACMMVGVQRSFQLRDRRDREALAELERLVPEPPAGSVFVPVRIEFPDSPEWALQYERLFWSVFHSWWSSPWAIKLQYRRGDIDAGFGADGRGWSAPTMHSVRVARIGRVEWERVIPFSVDPDGHVSLVPEVRWTTPTGVQRRLRLEHITPPAHAAGEVFEFPTEGE